MPEYQGGPRGSSREGQTFRSPLGVLSREEKAQNTFFLGPRVLVEAVAQGGEMTFEARTQENECLQ